jgi:hypothetical protein
MEAEGPSRENLGNMTSQLCYVHAETALHLIAQCAYSWNIWHHLADWSGLQWHTAPTLGYRRLKT